MKILKKFFKVIIILIVIGLAGFVGMIIYALISDYTPEEKSTISVNESPTVVSDTSELTLMTWNIGYCGLDRDMDFFYDGGTKVFTPKEKCIENQAAVENFLMLNDSIDFLFIQEIDKASKRSYRINQYDSLAGKLESMKGFFAKNYDVFFVPLPPASPMGQVLSGLSTLSKGQPSVSIRYSFPGEYGFPKQLFMLDRCFLVNRYPLTNGRELIIINTHNEAFDKGNIRKAQMAYLREFILSEYNKNNYIITGGDWNQTPPAFRPAFASNVPDTANLAIPEDFLPSGWKWLFDNTNPSEREVVKAYDASVTPTTIYDFFLISPNIKAVSVKCINLNFANSDHNPVIVKVKLNQ
ncbi:MAG: endonuclease/exonuclease/phosphatase family protein [Bacteroidales bacterium]|nr:endonuclease/exonuclease/phosphatase family protein [Bacteroidales bacterium]